MSISKIAANIANSRPVQKHLENSINNPKYLTNFLLAASVSKDVFAYTLRVENAKKNKEIPENKKDFVIAMDKATGVTTTIVQLGAGSLIASDRFQNFCTSRLFSDIANDKKLFNIAKSSFAVISTLVGAVLLAKRIIVPLIATPLASCFIESRQDCHKSKGLAAPPAGGAAVGAAMPLERMIQSGPSCSIV